MFLIKLAVRNLFRNFRRSLLTMTTIFVGSFGFILSSGLANGVEQSFIRVEIETETGHLRILRKGYLEEEENLPLDITLAETETITKALQTRWPSAIPVPRIIFSGQLSDGTSTLQVRGVAVEPKAFEQAFRFTAYGQKKIPLPPQKDEIYIGGFLAQSFQKKVGDTLTLLSRTQAGSFNAIDFKIADIVTSQNILIDSFSILLPLETARRFLQMPKGVTDLVVRLPSKSDAPAASALVKALSPQIAPQTWQEKTQTIIELNKMRRGLLNFMLFIIFLVAAAGMANTILMSAFERKAEIGMMMALGMPEGRIVRLFAAEAAMLGVFGSFFGILTGGALSYYFQVYGLDFSKAMNDSYSTASGISMANVIYFDTSLPIMLGGFVLGVAISIIASLWPAWRTTRFEPRDVLARS